MDSGVELLKVEDLWVETLGVAVESRGQLIEFQVFLFVSVLSLCARPFPRYFLLILHIFCGESSQRGLSLVGVVVGLAVRGC